MSERELNNDQSFEEAYASLWEAVEDVLTGYRRSVDFWSRLKNPWTGRTGVTLLSSPSVSPEITSRAVGKLINELGVDFRNGFEIREAERLDQYYHVGSTIAFQTGKAKIVIARRKVYEKFGGDKLAGVIWSIENLQPMNRKEILCEKAQQIIGRVREATLGSEQYIQP